jgi:hypothetical protein
MLLFKSESTYGHKNQPIFGHADGRLKKKEKKKVQYKSEPILNNKKCLRALSQKENIGI